mmetsp:Transcript_10483/g.12762  ORF Transcript_10483/g.12762 Transcript_10483/m.12762 type:complete len:891 (+) Transcript_10483:262-2934(+)
MYDSTNVPKGGNGLNRSSSCNIRCKSSSGCLILSSALMALTTPATSYHSIPIRVASSQTINGFGIRDQQSSTFRNKQQSRIINNRGGDGNQYYKGLSQSPSSTSLFDIPADGGISSLGGFSDPFQAIAAVFDAASSAVSAISASKTSSEIRRKRRQFLNHVNNPAPSGTTPLSDHDDEFGRGLTQFHQSLKSQRNRQRFVTGKNPIFVTIKESPARRWLSSASTSSSQILINGTTIDRSLASIDHYYWLDEKERTEYSNQQHLLSLELLGEISVRKPSYLHILPRMKHDGAVVNQPQQDPPPKKDNTDTLWITNFSLTRQGGLTSLDIATGEMTKMQSSFLWPNEINAVPPSSTQIRSATAANEDGAWKTTSSDAVLVTDGFLVPGRDQGGIYIVQNPGNSNNSPISSALETKICLAGGSRDAEGDWFYHRAIWIDLTADGRQSILTARAKPPSLIGGGGEAASTDTTTASSSPSGQLVFIERPLPNHYDDNTGTPLNADGSLFDPFSSQHTPWKVTVLDEGPDVMFSVADLDPNDDTVEVIASQFFGHSVTLHSIQRGAAPIVSFRRVLDDRCGACFSSVLTDLDGVACSTANDDRKNAANVISPPVVVDGGCTVQTLSPGDAFSHILVTSHECTYSDEDSSSSSLDKNKNKNQHTEMDTSKKDSYDHHSTIQMGRSDGSVDSIDGGSLFAYRIPTSTASAWKTERWERHVIATGFRVRGQLGNMINPGAPGFCYPFYLTNDEHTNDDSENKNGRQQQYHQKRRRRPLIAISGDCAEAAYILRPVDIENNDENDENKDQRFATSPLAKKDGSTLYSLMCEIECGATVGSIAIGYDDFCCGMADSQQQQQPRKQNYAKLYIPSYEQDKVHVFGFGTGEEYEDEGDGSFWG